MKYSPSALKKIIKNFEQGFAPCPRHYSFSRVATPADEEDGGWLNGRPYQIRAGDVIVSGEYDARVIGNVL